MKKIENFSRCLHVLREAKYEQCKTDEIYRTGLIGQFNLCFELGWKALQAVLAEHGIGEGMMGSPREVLKQGYRVGFLTEETVWLKMLRSRNLSVHVYDEQAADAMIAQIREEYVPAMQALEQTLREKAVQA